MEIFPRETLKYIDTRFQAYFIGHKTRLSLREASTLVDYVSGPVPQPCGSGAQDYTKPLVHGGGKTRPTSFQVDEIMRRIEEDRENAEEWAGVFAELIDRCQREPDAENVINYCYRDRLREEDICEKMNIDRATYYRYKTTILIRAGILAVQKNFLEY